MNNVNSHGQPTASGAANTASSASHQGHGNSIQQLKLLSCCCIAITALGGYVPTQTPAVLTEVAPKRLVKLSLSVKEPASTASLSHALAPTLDAPVQAPVSLSLSLNANRAQHHDLNAPTVGTPLSAGSKRRHNSPTHTAADLSAKTAIATEPSHAKIKNSNSQPLNPLPILKLNHLFQHLSLLPQQLNSKKSELIPIPGTLKSYFTKICGTA
ncbi:hypothetical protein BSLG_005793 [Batrachochytrium salamandrivorans]|nr:hypothetical protein BSLG_005793 [Batrachochytrium salamandrivorans]